MGSGDSFARRCARLVRRAAISGRSLRLRCEPVAVGDQLRAAGVCEVGEVAALGRKALVRGESQVRVVLLDHPFQAGLWEYRRILVTSNSGRPRFAGLRKCADPSTDIRRKMEQLKSRDCEFSPLVFRDGGYVSSWTCPTPHGLMRFRHVLIVRDPTSYLAMSEIRIGQRVIRQKLEARRLGECPGAEGDVPTNPTGFALPSAQE